jgi:excisionase family DNA binding protein
MPKTVKTSPSRPTDEQEWFTPAEAARYLRVTRQTIYNLMNDKSLPYYELKTIRGRRLRRSDLDALLVRADNAADDAGSGTET